MQTLQRRKLNSLPSDLRKIADELIAAKFPEPKKEVRKISSSPFPGFNEFRQEYGHIGIDMGFASYEESAFGFSDDGIAASTLVTATRHEPGVDRRINFHTRSSYSVTQITRADTRAFRDAIQRLDYENAPHNRRRASVSPQFARELMSHPDFPMFAAFREDRYRGYNYGHYIGEMFGVPIFATEGVYPEIIAE